MLQTPLRVLPRGSQAARNRHAVQRGGREWPRGPGGSGAASGMGYSSPLFTQSPQPGHGPTADRCGPKGQFTPFQKKGQLRGFLGQGEPVGASGSRPRTHRAASHPAQPLSRAVLGLPGGTHLPWPLVEVGGGGLCPVLGWRPQTPPAHSPQPGPLTPGPPLL